MLWLLRADDATMDIDRLAGKVPKELSESLKARGILRLTPPQALAIGKGLLDGKSMVIASPTASGKTLVAEIACIRMILGKFKKAVYVAPMRAIATEKYNEFRELYPFVRCALSIGDLDSDDKWLGAYQMAFFSTEKLDSLIRHGAEWLRDVGCIVFDEVHMVGDPSRGPTMELLITRLKRMGNVQIIALSATVGNAPEIAEWLDAELVESDYRPVPLVRGITFHGMLHTYGDNDSVRALNSASEVPELSIVDDTLSIGKQAIVFYSTRRSAEAGAVRISKHISKREDSGAVANLSELSKQVSEVLETPTDQCKKLGLVVSNGVAFHHAGLMNQQRNLVEHAFKDGLIKVVCATTTLGYGVNMPAHTVLIRDTTRFGGGYSEHISANEVIQLFGRAGRPRYDTEGRAVLAAGNAAHAAELKERYINAESEPISSFLGAAPVLRSHVLAFVSVNEFRTHYAICEFLRGSLYSLQYGEKSHIDASIASILSELERWGFIEQSGEVYTATKLGRRVSELYIDPLSARLMLDTLNGAKDFFDILLAISNTIEMKPHVGATEEAEERYAAHLHNRGSAIPGGSEYDYLEYDPVRIFSTALMLNDWADEKKEFEIVKKYKSTPGALYNKLSSADWMIYSGAELARISGVGQSSIIKARVRLRYGIKEELLDLVRLEQIGRARARILFEHGITRAQQIPANRETVIRLLGTEVAKSVLKQFE